MIKNSASQFRREKRMLLTRASTIGLRVTFEYCIIIANTGSFIEGVLLRLYGVIIQALATYYLPVESVNELAKTSLKQLHLFGRDSIICNCVHLSIMMFSTTIDLMFLESPVHR